VGGFHRVTSAFQKGLGGKDEILVIVDHQDILFFASHFLSPFLLFFDFC
jgi:hypothetical protein